MAHEHIVQRHPKALGQVMDGLRIKMALNEHQFKMNFRVDLIQKISDPWPAALGYLPVFLRVHDSNLPGSHSDPRDHDDPESPGGERPSAVTV